MNGGECHTGERYRWQRARARIGCLSPGYILYGNPSHRSVCPCTVSHLLAPTMSRTYVIRAATSETDGEAMQPQMQEAAAALAASSAATTAPGSPSGAAHNLQGALDAAAEQGTMVSSSAEAQRNWTRLGAQRQLNEPMDLEPGAQEPHAEPRRAAVAAEPHKRRALPAGAAPSPEVPEGGTIVSRVLGDGLPGEEQQHAMRSSAAGSSTGTTSAARWGDGRKPCARPVTAGSRRAGLLERSTVSTHH